MVVLLTVELEVTLLMLYPHRVYLLKTTLVQVFTVEAAAVVAAETVVLEDLVVLEDKVEQVVLVPTSHMLEPLVNHIKRAQTGINFNTDADNMVVTTQARTQGQIIMQLVTQKKEAIPTVQVDGNTMKITMMMIEKDIVLDVITVHIHPIHQVELVEPEVLEDLEVLVEPEVMVA
tara:strand:- start:153 stop:677 length:525 start_codon:yes stop_codon:yes gene_type:complete